MTFQIWRSFQVWFLEDALPLHGADLGAGFGNALGAEAKEIPGSDPRYLLDHPT
jgi:hypothetical protein